MLLDTRGNQWICSKCVSKTNSLEALLANDPEHPAIRHFIVMVKRLIDVADEKQNAKTDLTAFMLIKQELGVMEKALPR